MTTFALGNRQKIISLVKKNLLLPLAAALILHYGALAQPSGLSIADITSGKYYAERIYGVNPSNDGETYTQLSPDRQQILRYSFKTGAQVGVVFDAATANGPTKLTNIDGYTMSPDEGRILIETETKYIYRRSYTAKCYIYDISTKRLTPLSDGGPQQAPLFSPDGTMVAFARANNLFLVKLLFDNAESQVTTDGRFNHVLNGIPDWVNEEEFSTNRSFCFTTDSKMLAWVRYDESQVPVYSMQMYKGMKPEVRENDEYPGSYDYKYPVAGARNSAVCVKTFDIESRAVREMAVPVDTDGYIPALRMTGDPARLAVVTLNRHQDRMDIYMVNPRSTVATLALRETDEKYIKEDAYTQLRFYGDKFVLTSERSGFRQLYLYNLQGQLLRQLTQGNFDVTAFYGYDPKTGDTYYQAADESPLRRNVFVADKQGKSRMLSTERGTNSATFATGFKYHMNVYSNSTTPYVTTLRDARGKTLTTLLDNAALKRNTDTLCGQKEFFTFATPEGVELNGWMIRPRNFDKERRYPVVLYQYGGPGSQEVTDSWNMGFMPGGLLETYLTERGYIAACVDGRGTGARGAEFEKCTYLHLGQLEAKDQVEAARYLGSLPYVDPTRIGIWGWSFGGFNTLMSMSEGRPVFKAGVAVAAPTNWKYYDTVYTERYMRTPQENPGYDDNPISRAAQLSGSLLLVHGTADDNVHFRNCAEYSEALVQQGKQFDMQVYTNRNHFIMGGQTRTHLMTRLTDYFLRNL
ncbi:MAG: S9 family peptidase [Alloprevotella sp.]|nr:S9 family peptidase [Alloprevotella sp.]